MFFFWFLLIYLSIQDTMQYEISLPITLLTIMLFMMFFSFYIGILSIIIMILFRNSRFIGEADLLFLPIGFYLCDYSLYFLIITPLIGLTIADFKKRETAMMFPIVISVLFINMYIKNI